MAQLELLDKALDLPAGIILLRQEVDLPGQAALRRAVKAIAREAPLARARTRGGMTSAAMSNCGAAGWWSDTKGYRYVTAQPANGRSWPAMPALFLETVARATRESLWPDFRPDACLINFYEAGAKMGLHQDRDERDFAQPIVTVSLGDSADFLIGGLERRDPAQAIHVHSGDVLIMGGTSRMRFHGVRKIYPGTSPLPEITGRYSLTFRKAL